MKRALLAIFSTVAAVVSVVRYDVPSAAQSNDQGPALQETVVIEPAQEPTTIIEAPITTTTTTVVSEMPKTTSTTTTSTTAPKPVRKTLNGPASPTAYGPVQVSVVVEGSRIVSVSTPVFPKTTAISAKLNQEAVVKLQTRAVSAQSATLDAISGATATSTGFINSLEGALEQL